MEAPPQVLLSDGGPEFRGETEEWLELWAVPDMVASLLAAKNR